MDFPVTYDTKEKVWSAPKTENYVDIYKSIGDALLDRFSQLDPRKVILINDDTSETLTVDDIRNGSLQCAYNLLRLNAKQGDVIIFLSNFSTHLTSVVFGCFMIGGIVYPLDINITEENLLYILEKTIPKFILCEESAYNRALNVISKLNLVDTKVLKFGETVESFLLKKSNSLTNFKLPKIENIDQVVGAYLCSSGSSGKPKISILSQKLLLHGSANFGNPNEDSVIYCNSIFRWISQIIIMLQSALGGILRITSNQTPCITKCAEILQKYHVTHLFIVSSGALELSIYFENLNIKVKDLEVLLVGGDKVPKALYPKAQKYFPNARLDICYGMTEVARFISCTKIVKKFGENGGSLRNGVSAKIINEKMMHLGPNQIGQICIKTDFIFSGYLHGERKTQEAFDTEGWFLTGDYGYFDHNKLLYIVVRYSEIIVVDGTKVFPSEIEDIMDEHPAIKSSVVVGVPHSIKGQLPASFVILNKNCETLKEEEALKRNIFYYLKERVPTHHLPTAGIHFIKKYPTTVTGKILRPELQKLATKAFSTKSNILMDFTEC